MIKDVIFFSFFSLKLFSCFLHFSRLDERGMSLNHVQRCNFFPSIFLAFSGPDERGMGLNPDQRCQNLKPFITRINQSFTKVECMYLIL